MSVRNILKEIGIFITLSICLSCENFLNIEPENSATNLNYWQNTQDIQAYVDGLHQSFRSAMGDYFILARDRGLPFDVLGNTWTRVSNNDFSGKGNAPFLSWWREYDAIAIANQLIENIGRADLPEDFHNQSLAQAYGIRAYLYFRLVQYFGDVPLCLSQANIGEKAREPWRNVLKAVHNDLDEVIKLAPSHSQLKYADGSAITSKQYISCHTAYAIKAYAYAWEAAWDKSQELWGKALSCALKVVESNEYEMVENPEAVCEQVLWGNTKEGILELDFRKLSVKDLKDAGAYIAGVCQKYPIINNTTIYTKRTPRISNNAFFSIFSNNEDLRIDAYAWNARDTRTWPTTTTQGAVYLQKWRHPLYFEDGMMEGEIAYYEDNDILIRYADLLLLVAECYQNIGDTENAEYYLNLVRNRAGLKNYSSMDGELKRAIFNERERELFLEGQRYFDIIRFGYIQELLRGKFKTLTDEDINRGALFLPLSSDFALLNPLAEQTPYWASQFPFN